MFLILLLAHPHLLKATARAQNRPTDPGSEPLLHSRDHLDPHVLGRHLWDLLLKTLHKAAEARVSARDDDVLEKVPPDIDVSFADRVHNHILHARETLRRVGLLEHRLQDRHFLGADLHSCTIG